MKTMRVLTTAAAAALVVATAGAAPAAAAADLIFTKDQGEEILSTFDGKPWWQMQAYCAGFHGATANYFDRQGERSRAKAAEAAGVDALNTAVRQLMRDRGVSAAEATKLAESAVQVGGRTTAQALNQDGTASFGQWNYWRSFCIDAKAAYVRAAR